MTVEELTIDIKARLTVTDETAEQCLRLIEIWQNEDGRRTVEREINPITNRVEYHTKYLEE